ncbi:MAG: response regulator, partial [Desulfobacteraceae bacterium]|nr:response regulator [Desulfobacteraceae bacterium]
TPQQLDYQQKMQSSANSLLRLIDDILDFSKVEAGKLDLESRDFYLEEVLENLDSIIKVKSTEKGLTFSAEISELISPCLVGDAFRLGQVLINLASNAVKFTDKGGIAVVVEPVEESEREVTLSFKIRDTGIGMSRERVDQLFQPFHQADTSITRKYGGTGLGLAISKRLVEMMGGEMNVRSEPGVGTQFTFTARFDKSNMEAPARMNDISKDLAKELLAGSHLLLVEDNEINLQVTRELLEHISIKATEANDGAQAVKLAVSEKFDGVLMDLQMPVMDGYSATRLLRKRTTLTGLPIIAMTASAMTGDRKKCLEAGMNDHIAKPIKPANLYETLIRWIRPDISPGTTAPTESVSSESIEDFPRLEGVDVRIGLSHVNGNRDLYIKVLENVYKRYRVIGEQSKTEADRGS